MSQELSSRKSILVLTPRPPYPIIGGDRRRIYTICRELSRYYNVNLLSLVESQRELEMELPEDGVFSGVERVYLPKWQSYLNSAIALFTGEPLQIAYYRSSRYRERVVEALNKADLVLAHLIRTGAYLVGQDKSKLLEMTDAISLNYRRLSNLSGRFAIRDIIYRLEHKRVLKAELQMAHLFDHSFLVSGVDRDYLCSQDASVRDLVSVSPLGIEVDSFEPITELSGAYNIAFVGNMVTTQNLDAAEWFATEVLPILQRRNAQYRLKVIGKIEQAGRARLERHSGVEVVGLVDRVRDSLLDCFTAVCPMRFGAGVQTKVLEYMAYGLPTVTTTIGNEGIDAPKEAIMVADSPEEMADCVEKLKSSPDLGKAIASAARRFVKERYDAQVVSQIILRQVENMLGK